MRIVCHYEEDAKRKVVEGEGEVKKSTARDEG